jgi:DNA-binding response OmpR family regulator
MPEHISAALMAGFDDYWTKPIQFELFLAGIDRLAAARATPSRPPQSAKAPDAP